MSKGLEAIKQRLINDGWLDEDGTGVYAEDLSIIEKELKALEVVRKHYEVCECYNNQYIMTDGLGGSVELTKEEYDLLKEVLL